MSKDCSFPHKFWFHWSKNCNNMWSPSSWTLKNSSKHLKSNSHHFYTVSPKNKRRNFLKQFHEVSITLITSQTKTVQKRKTADQYFSFKKILNKMAHWIQQCRKRMIHNDRAGFYSRYVSLVQYSKINLCTPTHKKSNEQKPYEQINWNRKKCLI